jgi:flagellar basal body L-ring protein FlgH
MGAQWYNVAATVGQVSLGVTAFLTVLIALFCVMAGVGLVRTPEPTGVVVKGSVTAVTAGCAAAEIDRPCTVTAQYMYNNTQYTSSFRSMQRYAVGDIIDVRIADEAAPSQAEEEFPKRAAGWGMLASAVISVCVAVGLAQFAADSRNFAAGAGILTFLQALVAVF